MAYDDSNDRSTLWVALLAVSGGLMILSVVVFDATTVESITYGLLVAAIVYGLGAVFRARD